MNVVISILEEVTFFFESVKDIIQNYRLNGHISLLQSLDLTILLMDDIINGMMLWCGRTYTMERALEGNFRWFSENGKNKASLRMIDVVDELEFRLKEKIRVGIPRQTWQFWTVKHLTELDVAMVLELDGMDWRIHDWMQRKNRGEF